MLCLDSEVFSALSTDITLINLLGGIKVYQPDQPNPAPDKNKFKAVVFEEISDPPASFADNKEVATRITYRILVYNWESLLPIMNAVERIMIGINFVRHSSSRLHELPVGMRGKEILFITLRECV